jgi:PqqD family protein of HPr-rel-A system
MTETTRWSVCGDLVHEAVSDDGFVVFDRVTGLTHFLNELPQMLLDSLGDQSMTPQQLVIHLAESAGMSAEDVPESTIQRILADLEQAELLVSERTDPD